MQLRSNKTMTKKITRMQKISIPALCILFFVTPYSIASTRPSKTKLSALNHRIANVKADLNRERTKRSRLQRNLQNLETSTARVGKSLSSTKHNLRTVQKQLRVLNQKKRATLNKLNSQENTLRQQMRTAYMLGREPYVKLILNQENPNTLSRILTYYKYISAQRVEAITALQNTIDNLKRYQQQIKTKYARLVALKLKQTQQRSDLKSLHQNRKHLLTALNRNIKNKGQRLSVLLGNKQRLEQTVIALERASQAQSYQSQNFRKLRGRLQWPAKGRLLNYFGTNIEQSELTWGGVLIKAPQGRAVRAIANGKVVFSKWMSGYGLLLIISHGNGYMTLYGRNQYLYKKAGDVVHKGDLIASVGETGGYKRPALYFAIRHNARPLNPSRWCR